MSHRDPSQLRALINLLNDVYATPPIACHHDASQCPIDTTDFPPNVTFVTPVISTGWGRFSVVEAGLATMRQLYRVADPDWFVLLSASDVPVARADVVRDALARADCDAFVDARPLMVNHTRVARSHGTFNPKLTHFDSAANVKIKSRFYLSPEIWIPIVRFKPKLRLGRYTFRLPIVTKRLKSQDIAIYYGDHWFIANRRVAALLTADSPLKSFLTQHYAGRAQADESFYQTMIMNDPELTVCLDNKRFAEWNGGGAHPMDLTVGQVDEIERSGAFFARKLAPGSPLYAIFRDRLTRPELVESRD